MLNFQKEIVNSLLSKDEHLGKILIIAKGLGLDQIVQDICLKYSSLFLDSSIDISHSHQSDINASSANAPSTSSPPLIFMLNYSDSQEELLMEYLSQNKETEIIETSNNSNKKITKKETRSSKTRIKENATNGNENSIPSSPHSIFKTIHSGMTRKKRMEIYKKGGLISISNKMMIIDLIGRAIPSLLSISAILILHIERVKEFGLESFIISIIKKSNPKIQILGFIEEIIFTNPERIFKSLFIGEMIIWPRFHHKVKKILDDESFKIDQITIEMPERMKMIQIELVNILNILFKEISKINPGFDDFQDDIIMGIKKLQSWKSLSELGLKTRELIKEISIVQDVLFHLFELDSIMFNWYLEMIVSADMTDHSYWLSLESAKVVLILSKERIKYIHNHHGNNDSNQNEIKIAKRENDNPNTISNESVTISEPLFKWIALEKILKEIETIKNQKSESESNQEENNKTETNVDQEESNQNKNETKANKNIKETILIVTDTISIAQRIKHVIAKGWKSLLNHSTRKYQEWKKRDINPIKKDQKIEESSNQDKNLNVSNDKDQSSSLPSDTDTDIIDSILISKNILIVSVDQVSNMNLLESLSYNHHLKAIILYNVNIAFIRMLEVFQAKQKQSKTLQNEKKLKKSKENEIKENSNIKIYSLAYRDSMEEQIYLFQIREEKDFFEQLIKLKAIIAPPLLEDISNSNSHFIHSSPLKKINSISDKKIRISKRNQNQNQNNSDNDNEIGIDHDSHIDNDKNDNDKNDSLTDNQQSHHRIIIDIRELSSFIPFTLYKKGFEIILKVMPIGDYQVSKQRIIERKTVSDLLSSLYSGRLYSQTERMMRSSFQESFLLIELANDQTGGLLMRPTATSTGTEILAGLTLLLIHFPKLKLLWTCDLAFTATIFEDLQIDQEEIILNNEKEREGQQDQEHEHDQVDQKQDDQENEIEIEITKQENKLKINENSSFIPNHNPQDILSKMTGVTRENIHSIMSKVKNLKELTRLSLNQLEEFMNPNNARKLWNFLHSSIREMN